MSNNDRNQQRGYLLMTVVVTLFILSAISLLMTRQSVIEGNTAKSEIDRDQARYVAEAGLKHALWQARQQGCGPYTDLTNQPFGEHRYSTTLSAATDQGSVSSYTLSVDQDTWINSKNPGATNGDDSKLDIELDAGDQGWGLTRFDLSTITANASILSATAWFYVQTDHPEGPIEVHATSSDWIESTANWNSMGNRIDEQVLAVIPAQPALGVWVSVNLTAQVQAWVNGQPNYGITLIALSDGTKAKYVSREGNASLQPYLEVKIGTAPSSPATLTATGTLANGISHQITRNDVTLYQQPAQYLSLQPDAASGYDGYIYEWRPTWNYGNSQEIWAENRYANSIASGLLKFDLNAIPRGALITSARLELYQTNTSLDGGPVSVHRVSQSWQEGSANGGSGTTNWTERDDSTAWSSVGGDFGPAVHTTTVPAGNAWSAWEIKDLVNGWVSGQYENHGLALIADGVGTAAHFASSDETDPLLRPKLTIAYRCACDIACLSPKGSGNLLMVVDGGAPSARETDRINLFESWGYTVNTVDSNSAQSAYNNALDNADVVYVPESVDGATVNDKLSGTSIGVVSEEGELNYWLGFAGGSSWPVGRTIEVIDTSHYISAPFPGGTLDIYSAAMEGLTVAGATAAGLQTLAQWNADASLATVDAGTILGGNEMGNPAPGRRVMLPLGREAGLNWDYLNNNALLLINRSLQWANVANCNDGNYRDEFSSVAFDNQDGDLNWRSDWVEIDGDGVGATTGNVWITNNELRLDDIPDSGLESSAARSLNLNGASAATLSFDLNLSNAVDQGADIALLEISTDGSNWTTLEDFSQWNGGYSDTLSYSLAGHLGLNTQIRFRIAAGYESNNEYLAIDNLNVRVCGTVLDSTLPIAHWKLDETSGITAADAVGGHDGTLINGPTWTSGQDAGAVDLDGINDYIDVPHDDNLSLNSFTISGWIRAREFVNFQIIINKGAQSNYFVQTTGNELHFGFYNGSWITFTSSSANLQINQWYHFAVSFDDSSGTASIYLDGSLIQTGTTTLSPLPNAANLTLGRSTFGDYWPGQLDDIRLYDSALSASQIAEMATTPPALNLLFVVADPLSLDADDSAKRTQFENWGFTVNLIDDASTQSEFDSATADNDVVFISESIDTSVLSTELVNTTTGVVLEEHNLSDEFDLINNTGQFDFTDLSVVDDSHYITETLGLGTFNLFTSPQQGTYVAGGQTANGLQFLGSWGTSETLGAIDTGAALIGGAAAPGRRVFLPWGGSLGVDTSLFTADAWTLLQRSLIWAAGADVVEGPTSSGSCDGTYRDEFNSASYTGSDGTLIWSSDWIEVNEADGPTRNDEVVQVDPLTSIPMPTLQLRVRDSDGGGEGVMREMDLSGASSASLSLYYRRYSLTDANDYVAVEISSNGLTGPWTELTRFDGAGTDSSYLTYSTDISNYIAANTAIRLISSANLGSFEEVWFDNIDISCSP